MNKRLLSTLTLSCFFLSGCWLWGGEEETTEEQAPIDLPSRVSDRPSALVGVFFSHFIANYNYLNATSALGGVGTLLTVLGGQSTAQTDETFILLQELGNVLGVDFVDIMNRSDNRAVALDRYSASLQGIANLSKQKVAELEQQIDSLEGRRREQRNTQTDLEREVRRALRDENFSLAAEKQELLSKAEKELAETESTLDQTEGILENFEKALEKAEERLIFMRENRTVLIAGIKIKDLPGLEEYGVLIEK